MIRTPDRFEPEPEPNKSYDYSDQGLTAVPEGLPKHITGSLDLSGNPLENVKALAGIRIDGSLWLVACDELRDVPNDMTIGGEIVVGESQTALIANIPDRYRVRTNGV